MTRAWCLACALLVVAATPACDDGVERDEIDDAIDDGQQRGLELGDLANEDIDEVDELSAMGIAAEIMIAIDESEILQAEAALEICDEELVCDYASFMIDEHSLHAAMVTDLAARLGVTPVENRVGVTLRAEAEDAVVRIADSVTPDLTYLDLQVTMHEQALVLVGALDTHITHPEFMNLLVVTQQASAAHSAEAQEILRTLF